MLTHLTAELVLDAHAVLGEGPVWDARAGVLWWVDIKGRLVHRFDPATGADTTIEAPSMVGAVALRAGGGLVAALEDGVWAVDLAAGAWQVLATLGEPPDVRANDAKCDPAGRLLVGTLAADERPVGGLFVLDADGRVRRLLDGLSIANGLAWSADGRTFYYIDSPTRRVDAFDYDPGSGALAGRRPHLAFDDESAMPDGMTIDAQGALWIAFWGAGEVRRYAPDRRLDAVVSVPATQVTSCTFGGPDLRDLYITTAARGIHGDALIHQPHAGGLFRVRTDVGGVPPFEFAG